MRTGRILYAAVLLAVLFCGLWGGSGPALLLAGFLAFLPVLSGLELFLFLESAVLSLSGEHSCSSGQSLLLKLKLEYRGLGLTGDTQIHMVSENRVFGTRREETCLLLPAGGRQRMYDMVLNTAVCGEKVLRIDRIVCKDMLGLFCGERSAEEVFTYLVSPYETQMYVSLQKHKEREQPGDIYDGRKSGTDVSEVFGLREYREGDPLQSIHWKLSGKMKQLIVREFGRPVNYHTLILLAPGFRCGTREVPEKAVSAVYDLGISLSRALLNQNMAHVAGYLSRGEICCIPVDSLNSYEKMIVELMKHPVQKDSSETLAAFLNQQLYRKYTKVVYVTAGGADASARNLSVMADLTILQVTEGPSGYLAEGHGCEVIGISIEEIRSKEHIIPF